MYWDVRRIFVRSRQFYIPSNDDCSSSNPAEFLLLDHNHPDSSPKEVYDFPMPWTRKDSYWYTSDGPSGIHFYDSSILRVPSEDINGHFLQSFKYDDQLFYQLSVSPKIEMADVEPRKIILLFDLVNEYHNYVVRNNLIQSLTYPIKRSTTQQDSLLFIMNDFEPRLLDETFQPRSEARIDAHLATVQNTIPLLNNLPFLMKKAVSILNELDTSGEIWIISNDDNHGNPKQTAMDVINQTLYQANNNVKFYIIDACMSGSGNDYLYENLFRLTKGNYKILRNYNEYDWHDVGIDCFAPTVSTVEVNPIPTNGLSYSRLPLNQGRASFNNMTRYFQIGIYEGSEPFTLQFYGNLNQSLYSRTRTLEDNSGSISEEQKKYIKTYWYGNYIFNELFEQPQNYETIKFIESLSTEHRILTPYSAFVLPGPEGYVGFTKLTAQDTLIQIPTSVEEIEEIPTDFLMAAYPNPFNPVTTIRIQRANQSLGRNAQIGIYNCMGQKLKTVHLGDLQENMITMKWDGTDDYGKTVASGVYLVVFQSEAWKQSIKVLLSR